MLFLLGLKMGCSLPHWMKLSGVSALILSAELNLALTDVCVDLRDVWRHVEAAHKVSLEVVKALSRVVLRHAELLLGLGLAVLAAHWHVHLILRAAGHKHLLVRTRARASEPHFELFLLLLSVLRLHL